MKQVFIIHGWTYSLDKWADICKLLESKGIEPKLLKIPGLTEPSDQVWDIDSYVDWLDGQLAGQDKPIVIGHSNGGRIALAYAQKHPGRLGQLILIDSAGVAHQQTKAKAKLKTLKALSKTGKAIGLGHLPVVKKGFYKLIGAQDYLQAPPNMKTTMQNMLKADQDMDLPSIQLPVTIIWGRDDTITPLSDGREIHQAIKGSKLLIIDSARHAPQATHPDKVAKIIMETIA